MEMACTLCESLLPGDTIETNTFLTHNDAKLHAHIHYIHVKYLHDGITEDDMLKKCFPKLSVAERPVLKNAKECTRVLDELCHSIFDRRPDMARAACNMCGVEIGLRRSSEKHRYLKVRTIIEHSCLHLDEKPFECLHCHASLASKGAVVGHLRHCHSLRSGGNDFECHSVKLHDEIVIAVTRCFSQRPGMKPASSDRRSVFGLCRKLFSKYPEMARAICNVCKSEVQLWKGTKEKRIHTRSITDHACHHLGIKTFKCRHCNIMADRRSCMTKHLQRVHHGVDQTRNDIEDQVKGRSSEISVEIKRCFSECKQTGNQSKEAKKKIRSEVSIRARTNASELGTQRLLFCNQLIREHVDFDGKIKCRLCTQRITAKNDRGILGTLIIEHVYRHLKRSVYECNVCNKQTCTYNAIAAHLRRMHALGMEKNHKCIDDNYHTEILDMAGKCFAKE